MQFLKDPVIIRGIMIVSGMLMLPLSCLHPFVASRTEICGAAILLIGWALKAPGHGGGQ